METLIKLPRSGAFMGSYSNKEKALNAPLGITADILPSIR